MIFSLFIWKEYYLQRILLNTQLSFIVILSYVEFLQIITAGSDTKSLEPFLFDWNQEEEKCQTFTLYVQIVKQDCVDIDEYQHICSACKICGK